MVLWRVELINDTPPSNKFYWLELSTVDEIIAGELSTRYQVTAYWGRLGYEANAKSQRKLVTDYEFKARQDLAYLVDKKIRRGYVVTSNAEPTNLPTADADVEAVEDYILFIG